MESYQLVNGDQSIAIGQAEFEAAKEDRDKLYQQLEIESWFAEVRHAVMAWREGLLRFATRMGSGVGREFVKIQVECESTTRMGAVLIATHGLRPRINKNHDDCPCEAACTIAWTLRDSCAHRSTRIFNTTVIAESTGFECPQLDYMPAKGRRIFELRVGSSTLLAQANNNKERKNLKKAAEELFPNGDIDVIAVMNQHIACINGSMEAYRSNSPWKKSVR